MKNSSIVRGALLALLAAVLFGASAPLVQKAGTHIGSWMTAALLYAGAAITGLLLRSTTAQEATLQRQHWPRLLLMAFFGAVIGPAALAWGLQHTSGMSASLMLALEAVFTVALSSLFYREQIDRRVGLAILLLTSGGVLLVLDSTESGTPQVMGLLAVMGATMAWGIDNTLSRALADIDPGRVVLGKAALGAVCSFLIAMATGPSTFPWLDGFGLFLIGATGYGLSLRFYLLAQRTFGAARTGSVFGAAPFIGALIAFGSHATRIAGGVRKAPKRGCWFDLKSGVLPYPVFPGSRYISQSLAYRRKYALHIVGKPNSIFEQNTPLHYPLTICYLISCFLRSAPKGCFGGDCPLERQSLF